MILERWAEHFNSVLNQPSQINDEASTRLPQVPTNRSLTSLLHWSRSAKLQGSCPVVKPLALMPLQEKSTKQAAQSPSANSLVSISPFGTKNSYLKSSEMPQLSTSTSGKEIASLVATTEESPFMSSAGKILARVLQNRLLEHLEQGLLQSQCGLRTGRGTTDMIFAARQLDEECVEQHRHLYTTIIYLTKAFDTVSRKGLWKIMEKFGCPRKFIATTRQCHDGTTDSPA